MPRKAKKTETFTAMMPGGEKIEFVDGGDINLDREVVLLPDGKRLSEARAAEIAEETIREVYRRQGRPALDGTRTRGTRSPQVAFRVPQRLAKRAEEVAASKGKTLSQLGREALEKYLDEIA
jgi:hypothetical protein